MAARLVNLAGMFFFRFMRSGGHGEQVLGGVSLQSLADWKEGDQGVVLDVLGNTRLSSRVRELGVASGARVRVLRAGCPTVIQVEEGRFCLRRADAALILARRAV
ncbi:MAG: FeoA family protein [bacterium]|nr:FeoA family protein [bacterium]